MATDIVVENHGSIFLLRPISDSGRVWIEENIGQQNGFKTVVNGIQADDLAVS